MVIGGQRGGDRSDGERRRVGGGNGRSLQLGGEKSLRRREGTKGSRGWGLEGRGGRGEEGGGATGGGATVGGAVMRTWLKGGAPVSSSRWWQWAGPEGRQGPLLVGGGSSLAGQEAGIQLLVGVGGRAGLARQEAGVQQQGELGDGRLHSAHLQDDSEHR